MSGICNVTVVVCVTVHQSKLHLQAMRINQVSHSLVAVILEDVVEVEDGGVAASVLMLYRHTPCLNRGLQKN